MKSTLPLLALAIGTFAVGTTEFAPMGLLTFIANDLKISIPAAGGLVSIYAIGVMIGAPLLTLTTGGLNRKTLLLGLMVLFTVGNALAAIAPGYGLLAAARVLTALCHGPFFGVGAIVASSLVPADKRGSAVAAMFMGLSIANVGGVPLATWIGQYIGWRVAFGGIAALGLLTLAAVQLALPKTGSGGAIDMASEIRVTLRPAVLLALVTTVVGSGAMFTVFTYITPILQTQTHGSPAFITAMLVIFGLGLTLGNYLGGRFADKALRMTLVVVLAALALLLVVFAITMKGPVMAAVTIFAWGMATFALVPALQSRVMLVAGDAPNLASAVNIGAFNLGNAVGAALGGAVISGGLGYPAVSLAGAGVAAAGLVLVLAARWNAPAAAAVRT